jgi:hypothetical protein
MFSAQIWFSSDAIPITDPLVIQLGNDAAIRNSAQKLIEDINDAKIVYVDSLIALTLICRKAIGAIFYVGHGSEQGLQIGVELIAWNEINSALQRMPAKEHYFAACFSTNIGKVQDKLVLGFPTIIDADVASLLIVMTYSYIHRQYNEVAQLIQQFFTESLLAKVIQPENPLYYVVGTQLPGWTPYGLYRPYAVYIHLNAADIGLIIMTGIFGAALVTAILAIVTGGIGAIIGPFLLGMAASMALIAQMDLQGVAPYEYVEIWIPIDPINEAAMLFLKYCWFRTTNYWWHSLLAFSIPLGPA